MIEPISSSLLVELVGGPADGSIISIPRGMYEYRVALPQSFDMPLDLGNGKDVTPVEIKYTTYKPQIFLNHRVIRKDGIELWNYCV